MNKNKKICSSDIPKIGTFLFGRSWRIKMATSLGLCQKTIRNWEIGMTVPNEKSINKLKKLAAARLCENTILKMNDIKPLVPLECSENLKKEILEDAWQMFLLTNSKLFIFKENIDEKR